MLILGIDPLLWKDRKFKEGIFLFYFSAVIAPNSYVPAGSRIPAYTMWAGTPARFVKNI